MGSIIYTVEGNIASFVSAGKADIQSLKCYFTPVQSGSGDPSPENVREIQGWNNINASIANNNLIDCSKLTNLLVSKGATLNTTNKTVVYSGSIANASGIILDKFENGQYTIIAKFDSTDNNKNLNIRVYYTDNTELLLSSTNAIINNGIYKFITNINKSIASIKFSWIAGTTTLYYETFGIFKGNIDINNYEPYRGQTIPVTFPVVGKNKFDPACDMLKNASAYTISSDQITQTGSDGRSWTDNSVKPIHLQAGTYRLSCSDGNNFNLRTSVDNYTANTQLYNGGGTFTLTKECDVKFKHSASSYPTTFTIQLEFGDTATTYEPYSSNNTVYGGYVDLVTGDIYQTWVNLPLTSSLNWHIANRNNNNGYYFYYEIYDNTLQALYSAGQYTLINQLEKYTHGKIENPWSAVGYNAWAYRASTNTTIRVSFPDEANITSVDDFKDWLDAQTNCSIVYPIANPQLIAKLSPTQLQTLVGRNNIWSNANDKVSVTYDIHETPQISNIKKKIIRNTPHIATSSGNIATFNTDMIAPIKSAKFYFNPIQEGEGDPSPANIRPIYGHNNLNIYQNNNTIPITFPTVGKNLLDITRTSKINPGVSASTTTIQNGIIAVDAVSGSARSYVMFEQIFPAGTYTIQAQNSGAVGTGVLLSTTEFNRSSYNSYYNAYRKAISSSDNTLTFTLTSASQIGLVLPNLTNESGNPGTLYDIQLEEGSIATTYEPYTNTIYGGYVDLITGNIYKTYEYKKLHELSWHNYATGGLIYVPTAIDQTAPIYCDKLIAKYNQTSWNSQPHLTLHTLSTYDDIFLRYSTTGQTASEYVTEVKSYLTDLDAKIAYKLKTPVLITTLTPQQLLTLRGTNNIWSTANGQTKIQYWTH